MYQGGGAAMEGVSPLAWKVPFGSCPQPLQRGFCHCPPQPALMACEALGRLQSHSLCQGAAPLRGRVGTAFPHGSLLGRPPQPLPALSFWAGGKAIIGFPPPKRSRCNLRFSPCSLSTAALARLGRPAFELSKKTSHYRGEAASL